MANFDVKCPDHYPMKCNLSPADKEYLVTEEKYKAFFIFQYKDNDEYLEPVLGKYFNNRNWKLFNAGKEAGRGTKFCNVCRYALASDFGIAALSPLNYNVFQEIGLMLGLQKPVLYLHNSTRNGDKLPFDIDDQIYIPYTSQDELEQKLEKQMGLLIAQVELYSEFQKQFRESLQKKVDSLTNDPWPVLDILKLFLIENRPLSPSYLESLPIINKTSYRQEIIDKLIDSGLMLKRVIKTGGYLHPVKSGFLTPEYEKVWEVNPDYRDILREIVFKK